MFCCIGSNALAYDKRDKIRQLIEKCDKKKQDDKDKKSGAASKKKPLVSLVIII